MGNTSGGRGVNGTDLVVCITSLDTIVRRSCRARVPRRPSIRVMRPRLTFFEPQGAVLQGSNSPQRGEAHRQAPEASHLRWMPTGPRGILGDAEHVWATVLGLDPPKFRSCVLLARLVGHVINTVWWQSYAGNIVLLKVNVGDLSQEWPEGSLFNSYYTEV